MDYNIKVVDTLKVIIAKHGVEILNDSSKCSSMFGDYEPKLYRERRLLNNVLSTGIALRLQNHNSMTEFDIMNELTHARQAVLETYFSDPYSTDIMINSIMASLGINVMLEVHIEQTSSSISISRLEQNVKIKAYKFKGKTYKDILSLLTALGESWNEGKRELFDGRLGSFFQDEKNAELKQRIQRGYISIKQTRNVGSTVADAVFCKFLYDGIGPSQLIWCGQIYRNMEELAKSMFTWLRSDDIMRVDKGIDVFGILLEMGIISCYMRGCGGFALEEIKKIETIEREYLYAQSDRKRIDLQAMCGVELMHRKYYYQGELISTPEDIERIMIRRAIGDIDQLDNISDGIMRNGADEDVEIDTVFLAWLKLLGYEKQANKYRHIPS